jgi:hypothetical protein
MGDATFNDIWVGLPLTMHSCIKLDDWHRRNPVAGICSSLCRGRPPQTELFPSAGDSQRRNLPLVTSSQSSRGICISFCQWRLINNGAWRCRARGSTPLRESMQWWSRVRPNGLPPDWSTRHSHPCRISVRFYSQHGLPATSNPWESPVTGANTLRDNAQNHTHKTTSLPIRPYQGTSPTH